MQYDTFLRLGGAPIAFPPVPYKTTVLHPDGRFEEREVKAGMRPVPLGAVAVKIHRPADPNYVLAYDIGRTLNLVSPTQVDRIKGVIEELQARGLMTDKEKVDRQPSKDDDWLENKMNCLGILLPWRRKAIRSWFYNPDTNPDCQDALSTNSILAVKSLGYGRVIVLPSGHTIAYSRAQQIYSHICGFRYFDAHNSKVTVGEYFGKSRGIVHGKRQIIFGPDFVTVGCQRVDHKAIMELAEREGWVAGYGV